MTDAAKPELTSDELEQARALVERALAEDLQGQCDVTSQLLIPAEAIGSCNIVMRKAGVLCGVPLIQLVGTAVDSQIRCELRGHDGQAFSAGSVVATLRGPTRGLLTAERTILNFLTLLSGTATLTHQYVSATQGTAARILDTRKTLPGLRSLQKYAVRCGGGTNHRSGLFDAVLVKDNHLAWYREQQTDTLADAVRTVRQQAPAGMTIEFEVDSLRQLQELLPAGPDIILLDNFSLADLRAAVQLRNEIDPAVQLEASGGVNLETVGPIASTGVDRISVGALTHSAPALDLAFDWNG